MLRIQTLGGLTVRLPDSSLPSTAAMQPRRLALLALLAKAGDQGVTRDKAIALLWPESGEEAGRRGLTQALYGLRTELRVGQLVQGVQELYLNREVASVDVIEFEEALASGAHERATSLYKGPFLDGFRVPNAPEFDRWIDDQRSELAREHGQLLERLGRRATERADWAAAADWWRRRAAVDPLDSRIALELMRALAAGGDRGGALQHARAHATLVDRELGLAPSSELLTFAETMRRAEAPRDASLGEIARPSAAHVADAAPAPSVAPPAPPDPNPSSPTARKSLGSMPAAARWLLAGGIAGAGLLLAVAMSGDRDEAGDPVLRSLRVSDQQHVTNDEGLELDPAISPDGKQVAYAAGLEGAMRIFVRQRDGSRAVAVSSSLGGDHRRPRWSPDGTRLLFHAERGIWLVPALGGSPRLIVTAPNDTATVHSAAWSRDGTQIAWVARDTVYLRPVDGERPRVLATLVVPHSLSWSPDGRWIAAVSGNSEFVYHRLGNLGPSALYLLPTQCERASSCPPVRVVAPTSLNTSPEWLDATRLVFVSNRGGGRDLFAVGVDADGDAADEPVRLSAGQDVHTVSAAADGRTLAYSVFRQSTNLWSLAIAPGQPRRLADATRITSGQQTIEGVDISPDGEWLVFDANRTGRQDIYVVPAGGGEPERVVSSPHDKFHVRWSPDGKSFAFHTFRDGVRRAATAPARGGPIRLVHPDGPVREEHTPIWMRDGYGLVYWRTFTQGTQLYVVRLTSDSTWSQERQLTHRGGIWPSFSADGSRMAYMIEPGVVRAMGADLDETSSRLVYAPPAPGADGVQVQNAVISPDGGAIIMKGEDRAGPGFWSLPIAGGTPRLLVRLDDPRRTAPRPEFASDGRRLFFMLSERDADVWAVRLEER